MIVSPADGTVEGIASFLVERMDMREDTVRDLEISCVRRIHPQKMPAHRKRDDNAIKMKFSDSYEHDLVISYASNLDGKDRLEIVILEYLLLVKSKVDAIAYRLRKHARETGGKKILTSLRLNDKTGGLVMAVRESKEEEWLHYTVEELGQLESKLTKGSRGGAAGADGEDESTSE